MDNFLHIFFIWVHILGVALFVGPQFFMAFAWVPASRRIADPQARIAAMKLITRRFGYIGGAGMALAARGASFSVSSARRSSNRSSGFFTWGYCSTGRAGAKRGNAV